MTTKVCLLDFDGVILKHKGGLDAVSKRCQSYVQRKTGITNTILSQRFNKHLYESTGHTVLGLQKMGYTAPIKEFNNYVYNNIDYNKIFENIHITHKNDINALKEIKDICKQNDIKLGIFSAAPEIWCKTILQLMDETVADVDVLSSITSDYLKPEQECYQMIEKQFPSANILFVDDKLMNLLPTYNNSKWNNFLLFDGVHINSPSFHLNGNIHMISELNDLIHQNALINF